MNDNIFVVLFISIAGIIFLVVSFVVIFVRNQSNLLKQQARLQQAEIAHQQELLKTVIVSQEAERKRIGQDLHDDVGTALSNLRITIEMFNKETGMSRADFANVSKQLIDKVVQDVRHISHNLSPPGIALYGFIGALEELCEYITSTGKLRVNIHNKITDILNELGETVSISLYRVMEELLNNTLKHAGASQIDIEFKLDGQHIVIDYQDNGRGCSSGINAGKGMGMQNIESRLNTIGADCLIGPQAGKGFNMQIKVAKASY